MIVFFDVLAMLRVALNTWGVEVKNVFFLDNGNTSLLFSVLSLIFIFTYLFIHAYILKQTPEKNLKIQKMTLFLLILA